MMRKCDSCGTAYAAQRSTSRFCSSVCRRRNGGAPRSRTLVVSVGEGVEDQGIGGDELISAVTRKLTAAGMRHSVLGELAVVLARALAREGESAAGRAAVARELSRVMTSALRGVKVAPDSLDDLKRRRDRKRRLDDRNGRPL